MRRLRVFTWHVHGSYLYYLSHANCDFYIPVDVTRSPGYFGRTPDFAWLDNVIEVPVEDVKELEFDVILYQSHQNYLKDQFEILTDKQRQLPKIFLEHDPPRGHPTDTVHPVDDPEVLLVHVTAFNQLMWNNRQTPTRIIDHGVKVPNNLIYTGDLNRGLVVVNNIMSRGRRLGSDIFTQMRTHVPLDLVGMGWKEAGGIGEIKHNELFKFMSRYRFFFNPIRYTSLGLSVCEAMMVGCPIVGLATTELVTVIRNGESGYIDTNLEVLKEYMHELIHNRNLADKLSRGAKSMALERFNINRFIRDWENTFRDVTGMNPSPAQKKFSRKSIAMISEHASPLASPGSIDSGGQNVYVGHIAKNLAKAGYNVDIFTRKDHPNQPEILKWQNGVRVIHVPAGPSEYIKKEELLRYMPEFTSYVMRFCCWQKRPYDLVHANFWMSGLTALALKVELGFPFVITFHALGRVRRLYQGKQDAFPDQRFNAEDKIIAGADYVIAECPQDFQDLIHYYNAPPSKLRIVPCGFDPDEIYRVPKAEARRRLSLPQDAFIVLQLGRMVPRKGVDLAIRGFADFVRSGEKTETPSIMVIVGGDSELPDPLFTPEIGRLMQVAREEEVAEKVIFVGRKQRDELKDYYSAADVFLTTPLYEPFGITPIEAMACGTPVIGTRVGGVKYSVIDGVTGFLVEVGDREALGRKLQRLYSDENLRRRMAQKAMSRAYLSFRWAQVTNSLTQLYDEVVSRLYDRTGEAHA